MKEHDTESPDCIHTTIWDEIAQEDDPFTAAVCYCAGYDVYGDLLGKVRWPEYLYLLIKQEPPDEYQADLLEDLAVSLANPGPRDHSVRAAMSTAAGGSTAASSLMSALAVGAGHFGGAREVFLAINNWEVCDRQLDKWQDCLQTDYAKQDPASVWPPLEHPPGFAPYSAACPTPVKQTLTHLTQIYSQGALGWLATNRTELESFAQRPLAMTGVAAAALVDLELNAREGEMLYLLLRLPGAAAHALEQHMQWKKYPFFKTGLTLTDDPAFKKGS